MERRLASDPRLAFAAMVVLDAKATGALLRRRLCVGRRRILQRAAPALDIPSILNRRKLISIARSVMRRRCDSASPVEYRQHLEALAAHHRQLETYADNCLENFENRAELVDAEIARVEGRELDAERLYEAAIRSARENGFVQNEALANELAARFYAAVVASRGSPGRTCETRGTAIGSGAPMERSGSSRRSIPISADEHPSSDPTRTVLTPVEHLDLSTVLKVSQAVQGETDLEKLIAAIMRLALEHAGAERGLLILPHGDAYRIEAEARSSHEGVTVDLRQTSIGADDLPQSVLQYVLRTRERVLLQDAAAASEFADDEYLRRHRARSVLCIPLAQASQAGRDHLSREQPDVRCLHASPDGAPRSARVRRGHLAGERAPLP